MTQGYRLMLNQRVPMRDGIELSADVWLPPTGDRFPALLLRNIYNNADRRYLSWMEPFVDAGYAVVAQDCRGRFDSDGTWDPYICEINDGYDTHEWVGTQPWCDGQVATYGVSYPGFTQTVPATLRNRHLKALVPIASQQDNWGHFRVSGAIQWSVATFFPTMIGRSMQTEPLAIVGADTMLRHLPLVSTVEDVLGYEMPFFRGIFEHDRYDEWWSRYSLRDRFGEVDVPAYFMTGWYDSLLRETLTVFQGWKSKARSDDARRLTRILVGPWAHGVSPFGREPIGPDGEFGDVAFGAHAVGDNIGEHLRWYDARLRGRPTGIDEEPPIRLFVMGANAWRGEQEWPLARTRWTDVFLGSSGRLSFERPTTADPPDRFTYDPADPVPSLGAQNQTMDVAGPRDRRAIEERPDVLVYTSDVLTSDLEVTGSIALELWAATDAADTDWTAALVDVAPDGRAIILCEGICRARYRDEMAPPVLVPPNTPTQFRVDMWSTSNAFLAGHRIRLEVSSSNFPRFDRNLNTGGRVGYETEWVVAHQTVFHDTDRPSHLVLPVIPPA
jgi:putative CocE/NonD family hydrolase